MRRSWGAVTSLVGRVPVYDVHGIEGDGGEGEQAGKET